MVVGFTGSREGMTDRQYAEVAALLLDATEEHHGDCIGADAEFHDLCLGLRIPVVLHPPTSARHRAFCEGGVRASRKTAPYLVRNKAIVAECDVLFAAPKETDEPTAQRAGGTWATIRHARKVGRALKVAAP